ncbi:TonB-dependent receptor plug domain-containing protein, partial [Pseudomonas aeruginosa]
MSSVNTLSRLAVAIALGVPLSSVLADEGSKELGTLTVVGDWLGEADQAVVQNHPGARSVVRRKDMVESGAQNVRDVLRKVPGVQVQDNNGTGGSDISLNVGVRGLTSRLSPRSTVMIDGVPAAV